MVTAFLLSLYVAQTMVGKPNDVLMRPVIPDARLMLQEWAQRELGLMPEELAQVQKELNPGWNELQKLTRTGGTIPAPHSALLAARHNKRLTELSIRASDVHALTNPTVAAQVGLSRAQQITVDSAFRGFFKWYADESSRLTTRRPTNGEVYIRSGPMPTPNESECLRRIAKARKQARDVLTPGQRIKLKSLMGQPPATLAVFGWLNRGPSVFLVGFENLISNLRVQEEMGFTMRQSRLLRERLSNDQGYRREIARLTSQQRAILNRLELQYQGPTAILRCDVVEALKLDDSLVDSLLLRLHDYQGREMNLQNNSDLEGRKRLWSERNNMLLAALSAQQRRKWNDMLGPKLDDIKPFGP